MYFFKDLAIILKIYYHINKDNSSIIFSPINKPSTAIE